MGYGVNSIVFVVPISIVERRFVYVHRNEVREQANGGNLIS